MTFDEAVENIKRCIAKTKEPSTEVLSDDQQRYLVAVQDAVLKTVDCFKVAHDTSFLPHLYNHQGDLLTWAEAFGADKRLKITESKTYQIGLALEQFLIALLAAHPLALRPKREEITSKIDDLRTTIKQYCQGIQAAYQQRLETCLSEQPVGLLPSEDHLVRDATHNTLSLRVQLCDIHASQEEITANLDAYQQAIAVLTQDAPLREAAIEALQQQRQTLLDIPLPPEAQVTPEPFIEIQRGVLSSLDTTISALRTEGAQVHELLKTAQQAALGRANALSSVSPQERLTRLAEIDVAMESTAATLLENEALLHALQAELAAQEPSLPQLEERFSVSTIEIQVQYQMVGERKQQLADFIDKLKTKHRFSMISEELCGNLKQAAVSLAPLYLAAETELQAYLREGRLRQAFFKRPARKNLCHEINERIAELEQQYLVQLQGYNHAASSISASIALIQAKQNAIYHAGLSIDLLKIKQQHLSMNRISTQLEFVLSDIKAQIKSLKTLLSGSPVTLEQMNENRVLQTQLSEWLASNATLFAALQAKIAEQAQQQQALQSCIDDAVAPLPEVFFQQKQAQDLQFQADQRSQQASLRAYTEVQALCDTYTSVSTELQLKAIVDELNTLGVRSQEIIRQDSLSKKRQILLEMKAKLADLDTRQGWFILLAGNHPLVEEISAIVGGLRLIQWELLAAQRQSLTRLGSRFFNADSSIFPSYLNERAVSYVLRDTFSRLLALVLGVFGYRTEAQRRADYVAKLKGKWIKLEANPDDDTIDLNECIAKGLHDFSPRKEQLKSLHAKLSLFQHEVAEVVVDANNVDPRPDLGSF